MNNELLKIKACRCILVLPENELISGLRPDILQAAIKRGKGYKRAASCEQRQAQVDQWQIYEWLKGNKIPENASSLIETANISELREGVIEFLLAKRNE